MLSSNSKTIPELPKSDVSSANIASMNFHNWSIILKGDMSIVGNRPFPLYEAELLTTDEYIERFMAPAGLTGLWQVEKRGDQGALSAEERKQLDIKYARNFSFGNDIKIICKTFTAFVQKENV